MTDFGTRDGFYILILFWTQPADETGCTHYSPLILLLVRIFSNIPGNEPAIAALRLFPMGIV